MSGYVQAAAAVYGVLQAKKSADAAKESAAAQQAALEEQERLQAEQDAMVAEQQAREDKIATERKIRLAEGRKGLLYGDETGVNEEESMLS